MSLSANLILLYLQVCRIQDESIEKGSVEGKNRIHTEGLSLHSARKKRRLVKICRHDRARWIHADTALPKKRRIQLRLWKQFREDSYRQGGDDE
jgi:hypothetical protein